MVWLEVASVKWVDGQRFSLLKDQEGWSVDVCVPGNIYIYFGGVLFSFPILSSLVVCILAVQRPGVDS